MPVANVTAGQTITEAWGDSVADSVNALEAADAAHAAASNPHPGYATDADLSAHAAAADPHAGYRLESADHSHASTGLQGGVVAHSALSGLTSGDPHTQYQLESEKGAASGYAPLDASSKVPAANLPSAPTVQVFTADGTWTKPAGARAVRVRAVGGGGGGGGANQPTAASTTAAAAGGAGGGYVEKLFDASALGATEPVVVGALGAGGAAGNNGGSPGGDSTFSSAGNLLTASGGTGGAGSGVSGGAVNGGGVGGAASGGDLNVRGSDGGIGICRTTNEASAGAGGASLLGGSVRPVGGNANGNTGYAYGGGGSGGRNGTSQSVARSGGNGTAGVVIVEVFY